jgi:hypothetical protein
LQKKRESVVEMKNLYNTQEVKINAVKPNALRAGQSNILSAG